jgi:hypothetical protein
MPSFRFSALMNPEYCAATISNTTTGCGKWINRFPSSPGDGFSSGFPPAGPTAFFFGAFPSMRRQSSRRCSSVKKGFVTKLSANVRYRQSVIFVMPGQFSSRHFPQRSLRRLHSAFARISASPALRTWSSPFAAVSS